MEANGGAGTRFPHKSECVRVALRCRPMNEDELTQSHVSVLNLDGSSRSCEIFSEVGGEKHSTGTKRFAFDAVYGPEATQEEIYNQSVAELVENAISGYNATIFAYGQTGSGKTYTMVGNISSRAEAGIIPRTLERIFEHIKKDKEKSYLLTASFLEIYNEGVRDLLSKSPPNLEVKEDEEEGWYTKGLTKFSLKTHADGINVLVAGLRNRKTASTLMNSESSRSHAIFALTIESCENSEDGSSSVLAGKLNLVDLAGSERHHPYFTTSETFNEATKINLSLTTLGKVVSALINPTAKHVPYRESKLTKLLKESLGGNTKTLVLSNVSPSSSSYSETLSTLRYTARIKQVKNVPIINQDPQNSMIIELQKEIVRLKLALRKRSEPCASDTEQTGSSAERTNSMGSNEYTVHQQYKEELSKARHEKELADTSRAHLLEELRKRDAFQQQYLEENDFIKQKILLLEEKIVNGSETVLLALQNQKQFEKAKEKLKHEASTVEANKIDLKKEYEEKALWKGKAKSKEEEIQSLKASYQLQWYSQVSSGLDKEAETAELKREKAELLKLLYIAEKQLKLKALIVEEFVPEEERLRIESDAIWDEATQRWRIASADYSGKTVRQNRPNSANGYDYPQTTYAQQKALTGNKDRCHGRYQKDVITAAEFLGTSCEEQSHEMPKGKHMSIEISSIMHSLLKELKRKFEPTKFVA